MTAQQLAERCKELGAPIHRTTITKIEGGRSRFDLGELLIIAAALEVPPMVLLYPDLPSGVVEVIPGHMVRSFDAYRWATGMPPGDVKKSNGYLLIESVCKLHELAVERNSLRMRLGLRGHELDPMEKKAMEDLANTKGWQIDTLTEYIRQLGGVFPDSAGSDVETDSHDRLNALTRELGGVRDA